MSIELKPIHLEGTYLLKGKERVVTTRPLRILDTSSKGNLQLFQFVIDLKLLAQSDMGMPPGIAHEYAESWIPFFKPGMTARDAIIRDIAKIGLPDKALKLRKRGDQDG